MVISSGSLLSLIQQPHLCSCCIEETGFSFPKTKKLGSHNCAHACLMLHVCNKQAIFFFAAMYARQGGHRWIAIITQHVDLSNERRDIERSATNFGYGPHPGSCLTMHPHRTSAMVDRIHTTCATSYFSVKPATKGPSLCCELLLLIHSKGFAFVEWLASK